MRKLRALLSGCAIALALSISSLAHAQFVFEELSTARERINFPELTVEEMRVIAQQSQVVLAGLYANRVQKQDFYPGVTDPAVAIQDVIDNIDSLTVAEMEEQIYEIFASQRDLHLNYIFPQPYSQSFTFLPLTLTRTKGFRNFFEVRVASTNIDQFAQFAPDQRVPEVGDQLLSYNGKPVRQAVDDLVNVGQGANRFGGFSGAVSRLTAAPQIINLLPEEDEVTMTFRSAKRGKYGRFEKYSITLPWINRTPAPAAEASLQRVQSFDSAPTKEKKLTRQDLFRAENIFQLEYTKFRRENGLMPKSEYPALDSNEPVLKWGIIENRRGRFAYLRLDSFVPASGNPDATIEEIRRLIFEEFDGTRGLIFDIRNNGGGFLDLADKLPQLFTRGDAVNAGGRLINTEVMLDTFNNPVSAFGPAFPVLRDALNEVAGTDATHSALVDFLNSPAQVNALGQIYNGPVAVLANSSSYSASDFFACQMQDSGAGFVFGEEPRTGAGGATVLEQSTFAQFGPPIFEPLPATHRLRTAFIQNIRRGLNAGQFIEDFGCEADLLVSPRKADLINGNEPQIERVTRALAYLSYFPRFRSSARAPSNDTLLLRTANDLDFPVRVTNTPKVRVSVNGRVIDEIYSYGFGTLTVPITFPTDLEVGQPNEVLIEGLNYFGKRQWNLKRQLVVLEAPVVVGDAGFSVDFSAENPTLSPFSVFNQNPPEAGWNLVSPNLQVGFNPNYQNNVSSDAFVSLDLTGLTGATVSFDLSYDTEPGFDFIQVFVNDGEGNRLVLLEQSGAGSVTSTESLDISSFAGKSDVQLHFLFTSDGSVVAPGVQLQKVSVSPATLEE